MPKLSNLCTYYLPGGQTDAEVFVKRNIYEAILYLFQFQNKNGRFPAVYLSLRMRGIKRSRGEEFARSRMRIRVIQLQNPPKDARFFTGSVDIHAIKTALKVSCIFSNFL